MWCRAKTTTIWHGDMVPEGTRVEMSDDAKPNPHAWLIEHTNNEMQENQEHDGKAKRHRGRPKKNMSK